MNHKSTFETNILGIDDSSDHCFFLFSFAKVILKSGLHSQPSATQTQSEFKSKIFELSEFMKEGVNIEVCGKVAEAAL